MERILDRINGPGDLKALPVKDLPGLCAELRERIIMTVSQTGGHLAPNLGTVEITVALLRMFDLPTDKIVWDVGHQAYAFKLLTGRRDRFCTLRQFHGISGFLRREESPYDVFGAGHSGTALSAALGMAVGRDRRGGAEHIIAVLGDAAAANGISFEAFNNVAATTGRLIVILNDNEMSIAANVGSLSSYFGKLLANPHYNRWKTSVEKLALRMRMGRLRRAYYRIEEAIKSLFLNNVVFEEFGLRYVGPIDGHNLSSLMAALTIAKASDKPILLHVSTIKGKGYRFAEAAPEKWHGTSPFEVETGEPTGKKGVRTWSKVFGTALERLAEKDERIIAITAAMQSGTGLADFASRFPDRFYDVGIAEEHAVVFAAGLAADGLTPVVAVYSTFAQRAVDPVIHDVCLQNLPVVLCLDRAGVVGDDGPTHHGVFDIALLRSVPGLTIMQPRDTSELVNMLYTATRMRKPVVIRYPRGAAPDVPLPESPAEVPIGQSEVVREGTDAHLWALGDMVPLAEQTADRLREKGIEAGVVNARFVRPLDRDRLTAHGTSSRCVATLENGVVAGGFGTAVQELLADEGCAARVLRFGWPDEFIPHGKPADLLEHYHLAPEAMAERIASVLQHAPATNAESR